jgi:hypothetical protein
MNQILLNGNKVKTPTSGNTPFSELMRFLKSQIDSNLALITRVKIDGNDIPNTEDEALASTPLGHFEHIEIFTSHPKEVADETLHDLMTFAQVLEDLCQHCAAQTEEAPFAHQFGRLIDGITTFTDAVSGVKQILKLGLFNSIQMLETELLTILREILQAKEKKDMPTLSNLLAEKLPLNLRKWRETGLPSLIRSRDS